MNVVQVICLIIASGLLVWSLVSFVLSLVSKAKARKAQKIDSPEREKGENHDWSSDCH